MVKTTYPLIESPWANWTGIWLLASVDTLVFAKRSTISKSFPAKAAGIWALAGVNSDVNLLTAAGSKGFATVAALEQAAGCVSLTVYGQTVVDERAAIRECCTAFSARENSFPM